MATRFYFSTAAAPYTPATIRGAWEQTAGAIAKQLHHLSANGPLGKETTTEIAIAETLTSGADDVLLGRWVGPPLGAQTLSGTFDAYVAMGESDTADADMALHIHVYVTEGDSDNVRGTLVSDLVRPADAEFSASYWYGRNLGGAQAFADLGVSEGDRLVVEVGYIARNTSATSYSGRFAYGYRNDKADLSAESQMCYPGGMSDYYWCNSWIEFSGTLTFKSQPAVVTRVAARTLSGENVSAMVTRVVARTLSPMPSNAIVTRVVGRTLSGAAVPARVTRVVVRTLSPQYVETRFLPESDVSGETVGLTWVELVDAAGARHVSSDVDLDDPATYYGGFKRAEVLEWGSIRRALSDYRGQPQSTTFSWTVSDVDYSWRTLLASAATATLLNTAVVIRMISDEARRAFDLARTIVRGLVRGYQLLPERKFRFSAEDTLSRLMRVKVPRRLITAADFPGLTTTATDGSVTTLEAAGKPVPVRYGIKSDERVTSTGTTLTTPTGITAAVTGGTAGETKKYAVTLMNGDYGDINLRPWNDHRGETDPAWITVANAPTDEDMMADPSSHHVVISVDAQVGAVGGRCYGRYPGNIYGLDALDKPGAFGVVPAGVYQYWEGLRPHGGADWNTQKHKGIPPAANTTGTTTDTGTGMVKPRYVGKETEGGVEKHVWLVAGHACASIPSIYIDGARQADSVMGAGGAWQVPGWNSVARYEDRNGHRYCLIKGLAGYTDPDDCASGEKTLTINVHGVESSGVGTGTVITSLPQIYLHFLRNFGFGDYQAGAWLASPTFPADPAPENGDLLYMIDEASFTAAETRAAARVPGGYPGACEIGGDDQEELRDVIAAFNVNLDINEGFSRKTQFMVSMEPSADELPAVTPATRITQERDIHRDSCEIEDVDDELFTVIPYRYGYRPADGTWAVEGEQRDDDAIATMLGEERLAPTLDLSMIDSAAVAADIVARTLARSNRPPRRITLRRGLAGLSDELGDVRYLTHADGAGASGFVDQPVRVLEHEVIPKEFVVREVVRDLEYLYRAASS